MYKPWAIDEPLIMAECGIILKWSNRWLGLVVSSCGVPGAVYVGQVGNILVIAMREDGKVPESIESGRIWHMRLPSVRPRGVVSLL